MNLDVIMLGESDRKTGAEADDPLSEISVMHSCSYNYSHRVDLASKNLP